MTTTDRLHFQKQAQQLKLLNELSVKWQSLLDNEEFYQQIVDMIQLRFNYNCIHIWSLKHGSSYKLRAQAGAYREHLTIGHTIPIEEGICGIVARTQKSYLSNDVSLEPNYTNRALGKRRGRRHHQRREL